MTWFVGAALCIVMQQFLSGLGTTLLCFLLPAIVVVVQTFQPPASLLHTIGVAQLAQKQSPVQLLHLADLDILLEPMDAPLPDGYFERVLI